MGCFLVQPALPPLTAKLALRKSMISHHNLTLPTQALAALRAADKASREVSEICSAIVRDNINSAAREETLEDFFDSF